MITCQNITWFQINSLLQLRPFWGQKSCSRQKHQVGFVNISCSTSFPTWWRLLQNPKAERSMSLISWCWYNCNQYDYCFFLHLFLFVNLPGSSHGFGEILLLRNAWWSTLNTNRLFRTLPFSAHGLPLNFPSAVVSWPLWTGILDDIPVKTISGELWGQPLGHVHIGFSIDGNKAACS